MINIPINNNNYTHFDILIMKIQMLSTNFHLTITNKIY